MLSVPRAVSPLDRKPLERARLRTVSSLGPSVVDTRPDPWEVFSKCWGNAWTLFSFQEDILEELLNDMALGSVPDEGASSLAVAPEYPPQLSLSPNLDIPAPYPHSEPPENPLKQLLMPQDGKCPLWAGRSWIWGDRPLHALNLSLHIAAAAA